MSTFTIPSSLDAARPVLTEMGGLINATKWSRAAIVAAYVTLPGSGGDRTRANRNTEICSTTDFAAFGITGLSSPQTVKRYVETWLAQRPRPRPGEVIDLEGLPEWPAAGQTGGRPRDSKAGDAAEIIKRRGAAEVVEQMSYNDQNMMAAAIARKQREEEPQRERDYQQQVLESGISNADSNQLADYAEARNKLVEPIWQAYHQLGFAVGDWDEYKRRLGPTDRASVRDGVQGIRDHLAVLDMYLTDDIVGEVLNHE
jgi:hypothetical protein